MMMMTTMMMMALCFKDQLGDFQVTLRNFEYFSSFFSESLAPTPTMDLVVVGSVCLGIAAGLLFSCLRRKRALSHEDFYSGLAESGDVPMDNAATVV
jgi:hypothetical protein